jgi:hypothetical protein
MAISFVEKSSWAYRLRQWGADIVWTTHEPLHQLLTQSAMLGVVKQVDALVGVVAQVIHFTDPTGQFNCQLGAAGAHSAQVQGHATTRGAQTPFVVSVIAF